MIGYAAMAALASGPAGQNAVPVRQIWCITTANFRATAALARLAPTLRSRSRTQLRRADAWRTLTSRTCAASGESIGIGVLSACTRGPARAWRPICAAIGSARNAAKARIKKQAT